MLLRRFLIMLVIGGLLAGASAAGYYVGGNGQATAQRASILRQVGRRLHNKDTAGARLVLAQAFGSGAITGAELRAAQRASDDRRRGLQLGRFRAASPRCQRCA